jgi:hypothetical protein
MYIDGEVRGCTPNRVWVHYIDHRNNSIAIRSKTVVRLFRMLEHTITKTGNFEDYEKELFRDERED